MFRAVEDHAAQHAPFAAERGAVPELAGVPSALVVGKTRAYVRVDAEWGDRGDPLEFFLARDAAGWRVAEVRIGESSWLRNYALAAPRYGGPDPLTGPFSAPWVRGGRRSWPGSAFQS